MSENMIDLINRLTLWNSWRSPKNIEYIDYFILKDGSISIKISNVRKECDKGFDELNKEVIIKDSELGDLAIYRKSIGDNKEIVLEILEDNVPVFFAIEAIRFFNETYID